jgi:hypothetical protein
MGWGAMVLNPVIPSDWFWGDPIDYRFHLAYFPKSGSEVKVGGFIVIQEANCQIVFRRDSNVRWSVIHWHDGKLYTVGGLNRWRMVEVFFKCRGRGFQSARDRQAGREIFQ